MVISFVLVQRVFWCTESLTTTYIFVRKGAGLAVFVFCGGWGKARCAGLRPHDDGRAHVRCRIESKRGRTEDMVGLGCKSKQVSRKQNIFSN